MQVKIYWIAHVQLGRLAIMPRPRGGDWLEDEIHALRESKVDIIVSLLEPDEAVEFELEPEAACCRRLVISQTASFVLDYSSNG